MLTHERRRPVRHPEQDADADQRAGRRVAVRPPHAPRRRELRADLQRDAQRRPQRHVQEHAEDRRATRGAAASGSAARSPPSCRCRWITGRPSSGRASSTPTIAATPASATTGRSSTTTSPRSRGTTRRGSPTRRRSARSQGRMALWPNTDMNTVSASGGLNLPGRSHATAFLSVGSLTNDNPLLPYTINSALVSPALDRPTSDVKARGDVDELRVHLAAGDDALVQRAVPPVRVRQPTVPFEIGNSVNYDTAIVALNQESEPFGSTRHTFDADASYTPIRYVGFRAGYTREAGRPHLPHRREHDRGHRARLGGSHRPRLDDGARRVRALEARRARRSIGWSCCRSASSRRCGSSTSRTATRIASTRSCRSRRCRSSPSTASAGIGRQEYPGTNFGLRSNDNHVYSVGFDYVPSNAVSLGASYGYETAPGAPRRSGSRPRASASTRRPGRSRWSASRSWSCACRRAPRPGGRRCPAGP